MKTSTLIYQPPYRKSRVWVPTAKYTNLRVEVGSSPENTSSPLRDVIVDPLVLTIKVSNLPTHQRFGTGHIELISSTAHVTCEEWQCTVRRIKSTSEQLQNAGKALRLSSHASSPAERCVKHTSGSPTPYPIDGISRSGPMYLDSSVIYDWQNLSKVWCLLLRVKATTSGSKPETRAIFPFPSVDTESQTMLKQTLGRRWKRMDSGVPNGPGNIVTLHQHN